MLPDLIIDVQAAQRGLATSASRTSGGKRSGSALTCTFLLRTFTKRIGRTDLSLLVADRGVLAAEAADDPVRMAAAKWNLGHILLAQGEPDGAEEVAIQAIEDLAAGHRDDDARCGRPWQGRCGWCRPSPRCGTTIPWTARDRLRDKASPAARMTGDTNVMWTVFGPTNVELHAVSVEMEMGEAGEALRLADDIDMSGRRRWNGRRPSPWRSPGAMSSGATIRACSCTWSTPRRAGRRTCVTTRLPATWCTGC